MFHSICRPTIMATALLSLSALPGIASEFERIKSASTFKSKVADRKAVTDWGWVMSRSDGTLVGKVNGEPGRGVWEWKRGFYCRTFSYASQSLPNNCQAVFISGDTLVFIRDWGQGDQTVLKLQ